MVTCPEQVVELSVSTKVIASEYKPIDVADQSITIEFVPCPETMAPPVFGSTLH